MAGTWDSVASVKAKAVPGDLIEFDRGVYSHYALYLGKGKLMNVWADDMQSTSAKVEELTLEKVCGDSRLRINNHDAIAKKYFSAEPRKTAEIIRAAKRLDGEVVEYWLGLKNCEYYSTLWRFGKGFSTQVANGASKVVTEAFKVLQPKLAKSTNLAEGKITAAAVYHYYDSLE